MQAGKTDSGRSIVEILGVLAIMGVITVMGISGYSQAVARLKRNKVQEDITKYAQEIRTLYAGRSLPSGSAIKAAVMGIMGIDTMPAPYGGEYIISAQAGDGHFAITVPTVTITDCNYFLNIVWPGARTPDGGAQPAGSEKPYVTTTDSKFSPDGRITSNRQDCVTYNANQNMSVIYN